MILAPGRIASVTDAVRPWRRVARGSPLGARAPRTTGGGVRFASGAAGGLSVVAIPWAEVSWADGHADEVDRTPVGPAPRRGLVADPYGSAPGQASVPGWESSTPLATASAGSAAVDRTWRLGDEAGGSPPSTSAPSGEEEWRDRRQGAPEGGAVSDPTGRPEQSMPRTDVAGPTAAVAHGLETPSPAGGSLDPWASDRPVPSGSFVDDPAATPNGALGDLVRRWNQGLEEGDPTGTSNAASVLPGPGARPVTPGGRVRSGSSPDQHAGDDHDPDQGRVRARGAGRAAGDRPGREVPDPHAVGAADRGSPVRGLVDQEDLLRVVGDALDEILRRDAEQHGIGWGGW